MRTHKHIETILMTFAAAICMAVATPVFAQEVEFADSVLVEEVDTLNPDPEWYVAPLTRDSVRAGKRALVAANACPIDSVQTFNVNSELESVAIYENGDTTRTMTWTVNSDGSRFGAARTEEKTTGDITFTASYEWDVTTNDWRGISKEEHTFTGNKETVQTVYDWVNGAWSANTQYTWEYDAAGREVEYITFTRNTAGELVYAQRREKAYNGAGLLVLDVQYGSYVNGAWLGSTKYVYDYNASGTQTLYEYYSSCVNGVWSGSIRNVYDFDPAGNKILEEKYSGMTNGEWKGASKYTASFTAGKEVEHINYKWIAASKSWQENIKYAKVYDGENLTDDASYLWNNGWVGNARTTKTYSGSLVASEIIWQWDSNNAVWTSKSKTETQYTGSKISVQTKSVWDGADWLNLSQLTNTYQSDLLTESYTRSWKEGAWQDSLRTINTYDAEKINTLSVSAAWNGAEWISTDSTTREVTYITIAGKNYTQEDVTMTWSAKTNMWTGVKRETKEYDAWGNVIQSDTYSYIVGTGWVNNVRHLYAYKDGNKKLETLNAYLTWNKTKGVWSGTTKTEKEYDDTNRLVKTSTYKWNTTHNDWEGLASTEDIYENGIKVTSYSYKWDAANWQWTGMFKHDYTYTSSGKIAEQIDWRYDAAGWYYDVKISNTYDSKGRTVKAERYQWIRTESRWCMTSTNETVYDADADGGRLRTEMVASGSNCEITSYSRNLYFYACDPKLVFTIRFVNEDGALLEAQQVNKGDIPIYHGETPSKQGDAQYTYTFAGWDAELTAVTGEATYSATFNSTVNKYLVTFKNGEETLQSTEVEYGSMPAYNGETPSQQGDAQYTYTFAGWDTELTAVTGEATYSATFSRTVNKYLVTFKNGEETLQSTEVEYGSMPAYNGETPSQQGDAQYTYTFAGWDAELTAVTGEATYSATFNSTINSYTITWLSDDGTTIAQDNIAYGLTPAHANIDKESTPQYTFSFRCWSPEPTSVTGDATYTAVFDSVINTYTVTFYFDDGETLIESKEWKYGETPSTSMTPAKTGEEHYYYHFAGWSPEVTAVTGDVAYTAVFTRLPKQYEITFRNYNNRVLLSTSVAYGTMPTYTGETPTRARTAQYTYIFSGWSPELTEVAGDATYTAVYESVLNQYTVLFLDEDGTELDRQTVDYGSTPTYQGETPTKESDEQYSYTFAGWSPRIVAVTKDATYTATYTKHDIHEGIDNIPDGWGDARKVMIDGTLYIRRGSHLYTADGVLVE